MDKITVRANPKCKNCLGSGVAAMVFGPADNICSCVTEQLRIIVTQKDYSIPREERYSPGQAQFSDEAGNMVIDPQKLVKERLPKPYKIGTMNEVLAKPCKTGIEDEG